MQLTLHTKAIDYDCLIPRALDWEGDFPGQYNAELDIISHRRDAARLGQSKDKSRADESTEKQFKKTNPKYKPPHKTLPLATQVKDPQ